MNKEEKYLRNLYESVQYDSELFNIYIGEDKVFLGAMFPESDNSNESLFFMCKTLYDSIIDLDQKLKKSFNLALFWAYYLEDEKITFFNSQTIERKEAIYYTENAVFRTGILWDLLAQLYNVRYKVNENPRRVYVSALFQIEVQSSHPNPLAQEIYNYITEDEDQSTRSTEKGFWIGNHKYVVDYRNKMTHRNSPNVMAISDYDIHFPVSMRYVLKRVIEDYFKASEFIKQLLQEIISDFNGD